VRPAASEGTALPQEGSNGVSEACSSRGHWTTSWPWRIGFNLSSPNPDPKHSCSVAAVSARIHRCTIAVRVLWALQPQRQSKGPVPSACTLTRGKLRRKDGSNGYPVLVRTTLSTLTYVHAWCKHSHTHMCVHDRANRATGCLRKSALSSGTTCAPPRSCPTSTYQLHRHPKAKASSSSSSSSSSNSNSSNSSSSRSSATAFKLSQQAPSSLPACSQATPTLPSAILSPGA